MIEIIKVLSKAQWKEFIHFPFVLYKNDPHWIPPLKFDERNTLSEYKNPAFDHCKAVSWLAYKNGQIAGRITGIINSLYIEKWGNKYARFGWFDCIEDEEVATELLRTVEYWAIQEGMVGIQGPMGFCDMDKEGMLVEGFEERGTFTTIYNYSYYPSYMDANGYVKDADWVEFIMEVPEELPGRIKKIIETVKQRYKLKVLHFKRAKDILPYGRAIFSLLNTAYKELYGVVPLTDRQIDFYIQQYFGMVNPEYIKLVVDEKGDLAAFGIVLPSMAEALKKANGRLIPFGFIHLLRAMRKNNTVDLLLIAVRPDLQSKGVNTLFMDEVFMVCRKNKVQFAEFNPQLEENYKVISQWKYYDIRQHKRRRCYFKQL